jgi:F-type H+-transporting ATPase subunit epsilon
MRLRVTTPTEIVLDEADVRYVRAEDDTGAFGIEAGHTEFVTALAVCVLTYRTVDGAEHHVAVRNGMLRVKDGRLVEVATREAMTGDDLETLERAVQGAFRARSEDDALARTRTTQLNVAVVRHLYRYVRAGRNGESPGFLARGSEGGS